jgi:acetylglutamate kinase
MSQKTSKKPLILFKYGGNAMSDPELKTAALSAMAQLSQEAYQVVIVHGGGPFIQAALDQVKITSEFIDGHRKTSPAAIVEVEKALKGQVNSDLVGILNQLGFSAVGLSGKDGALITARKRIHRQNNQGKITEIDLERVGDVALVKVDLIKN